MVLEWARRGYAGRTGRLRGLS